MALRKFKERIKGDIWLVYLHTDPDTFQAETGEDPEATDAVTQAAKRRLHFMKECADVPTIIHELVHAYYDYLCLDSASITAGQLEEILADMFGYNGVEMVVRAQKLHKKFHGTKSGKPSK